jgi:hypothetical protein
MQGSVQACATYNEHGATRMQRMRRHVLIIVLLASCSRAPGSERPRSPAGARVAHAMNVAFAGMNVGLNFFEMYASSRGGKHLDAMAWTEYRQGVSSQPVPSIPMFQVGSVAAGGSVLYFERDYRSRSFQLAAGGLALGLAGIITTLAITAPAQSEIDGWDPAAPPADWEDYKTRLGRANILRTSLHGAALALNILALTVAF